MNFFSLSYKNLSGVSSLRTHELSILQTLVVLKSSVALSIL